LALALADASGTGLDHASLATRVHGPALVVERGREHA